MCNCCSFLLTCACDDSLRSTKRKAKTRGKRRKDGLACWASGASRSARVERARRWSLQSVAARRQEKAEIFICARDRSSRSFLLALLPRLASLAAGVGDELRSPTNDHLPSVRLPSPPTPISISLEDPTTTSPSLPRRRLRPRPPCRRYHSPPQQIIERSDSRLWGAGGEGLFGCRAEIGRTAGRGGTEEV
jgi:hypothetical protein